MLNLAELIYDLMENKKTLEQAKKIKKLVPPNQHNNAKGISLNRERKVELAIKNCKMKLLLIKAKHSKSRKSSHMQIQ